MTKKSQCIYIVIICLWLVLAYLAKPDKVKDPNNNLIWQSNGGLLKVPKSCHERLKYNLKVKC